MAYLSLNSKTLELSLKVGVLEEYSPSEDIIFVAQQVEQLKDHTKQIMVQLFGEGTSKVEISKRLSEDLDLEKKWRDYLETDYNKELSIIIDRIKDVNKRICPNIKDLG